MPARVSEFVVEQMSQRSLRMSLLVSGLTGILLLAGAFYLGEQAAYSGMGLDPEHYRDLEEKVPQLKERIAKLESESAVQRTRAAVDASALEMVRKDLAIQQEEISSLEEGLRFYRSLMAPGEIAQGLSLRPLELVVLAQEERRYAFRIVAQQESRKHDMLRGSLRAEVFGMQGGLEVSYPLAELSDDVDGESIDLKFRYFQSVEGSLTLPEGFEAAGISVEADASKPSKMEARERFPWQPREKFANVGL